MTRSLSTRRQRTTATVRSGVLRRLRGSDEGIALVLVIGSMLVLAMLALTALTYSMAGQKFARYDQDYTAAMAAAQSGVEDFISRMNRNDGYAYTVDCTNQAWKGPRTASDPPNTCGWNASTAPGWLPVEPGATDPRAAAFHYRIDTSGQGQGTYQLYVTGRVNDRYRTIDVTVGKGGSTDYVYYTDFESADPANVQAYGSGGTGTVACGRDGATAASYWHSSSATDGKSTRSGKGCTEITFIGGDVLDGEVMTNDTIYGTVRSGQKPKFLKQVWTADKDCLSAGATNSSWESACLRSGSVADFNGTKPKYHEPLNLMDNAASFVTVPGCHYYGSTRIKFTNDGKMTVWNKTSVNGNTPPDAVPVGGVTPTCGTLAQLNSTSGATVPVPNEQAIYVAASPSASAQRQCYREELGGPSGQLLPVGTYTGAAPTSTSSTYTADSNMLETTKYCGAGNLYAEGVVKGRVTLAAAQSIIVTGDLVLAGGLSGTDMLGLVATNSVEIFHPRLGTVGATAECTRYWSNGSCRTYGSPQWLTTTTGDAEVSGWPRRYKENGAAGFTPASGVQIAGSIQTLLHSFLVQKYNVGGDKGTLQVNGSIAQRWRGIVGQGSEGYTKLYKYDPRLQFSTPPYFPKWANAKYTLRYSGEINTPASLKG